MKNSFSTLIYNLIGIASITNEKLKELIEDLIQNEHFTEEEGKRIVDDSLVNFRTQVDSVNGLVLNQVDLILKKWGLPDFYTLKDEISNYINTVKENPTSLMKIK